MSSLAEQARTRVLESLLVGSIYQIRTSQRSQLTCGLSGIRRRDNHRVGESVLMAWMTPHRHESATDVGAMLPRFEGAWVFLIPITSSMGLDATKS